MKRVKLRLIPLGRDWSLPASYNYQINQAIYRILSASSDEYATYLHDEGYIYNDKSFRLFTFSFIKCPSTVEDGQLIPRYPKKGFDLLISSASEDFMKHLVNGIIKLPVVEIDEYRFRIKSIELEKEAVITNKERFVMLSPLVVSENREGKKYYLTVDDDITERIKKNLIEKYAIIYGLQKLREKEKVPLKIIFDKDYIERKRGDVYKLVRIKSFNVRGIFAPFTIEGDKELIKIGYYAGFGERNSMGFGMVAKYVKQRRK